MTIGPGGHPSCGLLWLGLVTGPWGPTRGGGLGLHLGLCDSLLEAVLDIPGPRQVWPVQELEAVGVRLHWHPCPGPHATPGSGFAEARTVVGSHHYPAGETTHSSGYQWPMRPQLAWRLLFLGPGTR